MTTSEHVTFPAESGTRHDWTVSDGNNRVSAHAYHFRDGTLPALVELAPSVAETTEPTESGWWLFVEILSHRTDGEGNCEAHHFCEVDVFTPTYANRAWAHIRTAGVTDASVFAELRRVHADEFGRVSS